MNTYIIQSRVEQITFQSTQSLQGTYISSDRWMPSSLDSGTYDRNV